MIIMLMIIMIKLKVIKMETEISVPDVITLKGDLSERLIRLENCHNQNEVMDYLKICLSLFSVNPETTITVDGPVTTLMSPDST